jgi:amino acid adenylation domain-containing protein
MNKKNIADIYPLTPMQQGMWFHSLAAPDSGVYVEQLSLTIEGHLDTAAFLHAWDQVIRRHPILRTAFVGEGLKEPVQAVYRQVTLPCTEDDWSHLTPSEQEAQLTAFLQSDRQHGFNLNRPPLMRLSLIRLGKAATQFTWTYHHLLLDGWSLPILLQEVMAFYEAERQGETLTLPPARPFRDYILWLKRQDTSKAEQFWRGTLDGFTAPTPLVVDRPGNGETAVHFDEIDEALTLQETAGLQALGRRHGLTLNTFVQAAWGLLLHRYSGEDDVLFGATVSGRPPDLPGAEMMIGLFINTLPVRVKIDPERPLLDLLHDVQAQQAELRQYEYSHLVQIQGWSAVPRGRPLFESILVFENYPIEETEPGEAGSLALRNIRSAEQTNFPLTVVAGVDEQVHLKIVYDCGLFDRQTAERMMGHLRTLLAGMITHPDKPIAALPLLTDKEYEQLLNWGSGHVTDYPLDLCTHELFEALAQSQPEETAVVYGDIKLTYLELNQHANQLAHHLQKLAVGPEALVGICVERSLEAIIGLLGVLKAGGAYLPLDPSYPPDRLAFMIADSQPRVLLTVSHLQSAILETLPIVNRQTKIINLDTDWSTIATESAENPSTTTTASNLAYVIYTSGSTGKPKGVLLQHRGLFNFVNALIYEYGAARRGSRVLQFAPFSFDASVAEIFIALLSGAALYLPAQATIQSPDDLHRYLQENEISLATMPPSMLKLLSSEDLPALGTVISAGEACTPDIVDRWAPGRQFFNGYGPTEVTVGPALYRAKPEMADTLTAVPIGRPIANTQMFLLDANQRSVPVGVPGEIHIGGLGLARGYLNRPSLTAEKFVPNRFQANRAARLYKTGDLARYLPDGNMEFLGRIDHQVKVRGYRIELGEIEAALREHTGVETAILMVREDSPGDQRLVAYVVPVGEAMLETSALRRTLQEKLPAYMIPSAFVVMDSLPLTPNRKIDRKALPAPEGVRATGTGFIAPRNPLEAQITQIWEDVLDVRPIGIQDNFFALGGHSLLAVRVMAQIQEKIASAAALVDLFQGPTIEHLAVTLQRYVQTEAPKPLVALQSQGEKRPLFFVHPSGGSIHWYVELARQMGTERPFYAFQAEGINGNGRLLTTIEEMAAQYINAMRDVQPAGPYQIGSWSMGVVIAYEMAQQLTAAGEIVSLLAILDQGPTLPAAEPESDAAYLVEVFGKELSLSLDDLQQLNADAQIAHVFEKARAVNWITPDVTLTQFRQFVRVLRTHTEAWRSYEIRPYPGPITLFRAEIQDDKSATDTDMGWDKLALGGVTIYDVPGDHLSMIHDPHVQKLAEQLKNCLETVSNKELIQEAA